jgi:putative hydrolase of the HAD superfamily
MTQMNKSINSREIKALFLDIGGVVLTNGWGHESRYLAVEKFGLNKEEMDERHQQVNDAYQLGKISLDEYLKTVVFYQQRAFSLYDFKAFMYEQSQALNGNIDFFKEIKQEYNLKVVAVSNEGRELNEYRIKQFRLDELFDAYVSSCYVHLQKPGTDILTLACDIFHVTAAQVLYIDDNIMLTDQAKSLGFHVIHFLGKEWSKELIKNGNF